MKIMVTGDRGYIGSVLVPMLIEKGHEVIGLDSGFFEEVCFLDYNNDYHKITKDIREVTKSELKGVEAIIHLAGLSNDPLGEFSPKLTEEINFSASVKLAQLAKESEVHRFIYASSQSMYGISKTDSELDEDNSLKNPVTSYAKEKWKAEQYLNKITSEDFVVTSFRPSTVYGASPRFRCDIVFNNLVACAYTTGRIEIKSDGSPWRPVVHVKDVCKAFIAGLIAPINLLSGRAFNVGSKNGNFTVRQIAEAARNAVPGSELLFTGEHTDPRTYKVSFNRIFQQLGDYYKPTWNLEKGGQELVSFFKKIDFSEKIFRGPETIRLKQLVRLSESGKVDNYFRFI